MRKIGVGAGGSASDRGSLAGASVLRTAARNGHRLPARVDPTGVGQWPRSLDIKASRLPLEKNWASLDLKRLPPKAVQQLRGLLSGEFLDRRENVLVFGPPGSGKTHGLCAVAQELVRAGRPVLHTKCSLLVQELLRAKRDLRLKEMLRELAHWEGLLIDDLGYVQQSREEMEVLFTLLAERYEMGSVMVTSNLAFSKWDQVFKDPMTTAAAIDRLVHHCTIVELNVPSYRVETAKKAQKGQS